MTRVCKVTEKELARRYLEVMNGILKLTEGELQLTAKIVDKYREYGGQGLRQPFLSKFVFAAESRRSIAASLGRISNQVLSNRLNQLVNKGVLTTEDGTYVLNPSLLPQPEITFKFVLIDDKPGKTVRESSKEDGNS